MFIPDLGSRIQISPSLIQGEKRQQIPDSDSQQRIQVFLTRIFFTKLSEIWSGIFILHLGSGFFSISDPGSRVQPVFESATLALHTKNDKVQKKIFSRKEPGAFSTTYVLQSALHIIRKIGNRCAFHPRLTVHSFGTVHTDRTFDNISFLSSISFLTAPEQVFDVPGTHIQKVNYQFLYK